MYETVRTALVCFLQLSNLLNLLSLYCDVYISLSFDDSWLEEKRQCQSQSWLPQTLIKSRTAFKLNLHWLYTGNRHQKRCYCINYILMTNRDPQRLIWYAYIMMTVHLILVTCWNINFLFQLIIIRILINLLIYSMILLIMYSTALHFIKRPFSRKVNAWEHVIIVFWSFLNNLHWESLWIWVNNRYSFILRFHPDHFLSTFCQYILLEMLLKKTIVTPTKAPSLHSIQYM